LPSLAGGHRSLATLAGGTRPSPIKRAQDDAPPLAIRTSRRPGRQAETTVPGSSDCALNRFAGGLRSTNRKTAADSQVSTSIRCRLCGTSRTGHRLSWPVSSAYVGCVYAADMAARGSASRSCSNLCRSRARSAARCPIRFGTKRRGRQTRVPRQSALTPSKSPRGRRNFKALIGTNHDARAGIIRLKSWS
jgi:hypothetical protein